MSTLLVESNRYISGRNFKLPVKLIKMYCGVHSLSVLGHLTNRLPVHETEKFQNQSAVCRTKRGYFLQFYPCNLQEQLQMTNTNQFEISQENLTTKISTQDFDKYPFSLLSTVHYKHPGSLRKRIFAEYTNLEFVVIFSHLGGMNNHAILR